MFLKSQISILEWFLRDHVTLKSNGVMATEHSDLPWQKYTIFYTYYNRIIFHNITVFTVFLIKTNAALLRI